MSPARRYTWLAYGLLVGAVVVVLVLLGLAKGRDAEPRPIERSALRVTTTTSTAPAPAMSKIEPIIDTTTTTRTPSTHVPAKVAQRAAPKRSAAVATTTTTAPAPPPALSPTPELPLRTDPSCYGSPPCLLESEPLSDTDYTWLFDQFARWNPCQPIRWQIVTPDPTYEPAHQQVLQAFAELSAMTGLEFTEVSESPAIAISWKAWDDPDYRGINGRGGSYLGADGWRVRGVAMLKVWPYNGASRIGVVRHELAHVLGLGHAVGRGQLMSDDDNSSDFQAGDIAGLRKLGRQAGDSCG